MTLNYSVAISNFVHGAKVMHQRADMFMPVARRK